MNTFLNSVYVFDDYLRVQINTSDGIAVVPLESLPKSPPGSDSICDVLLPTTHPNQVILSFLVRMQKDGA